uniref:Bromo domain-containing protein n=1 Tax=Ficedula albicollis TaxID=59894 RepID=U3JG47_FICAL
MQNIVPASQRAVTSSGHALSPVIRPLLERTFTKLLEVLHKVFPHAEFSQADKSEVTLGCSQECCPSIAEHFLAQQSWPLQCSAVQLSGCAYHQPTSYRPRLLLSGERGSGQTSHLAPALLHTLEKFSVHRLDLPALYSVSAKTPEESCAQIFREARRTVPSIVYMPHIGDWWEAVSETVRATFLTLLQDIPSFSPIFLLSTSESMFSDLPEEVSLLIQYEEVFYIQRPSEEDRLRFFKGLILDEAAMPPPRRKQAALRALEVLPLALPCPARELSEAEKQRMEDQEENTLRELRLFLRDVTKRLATDKRFNIFSKPVDIEEVSDYLEVIKEPMDLSTVITKIDKHNYLTAKDFLTDIDLICSNALEYNPDKDPGDKIIRHRACTLKDTAHAIIAAELDPEFNKMCEEIKEARRKRGMFNFSYHNTTHIEALYRQIGMGSCSQALDLVGSSNIPVCTEGTTERAEDIQERKSRRRSQWGKGIIKKRKVNNLKKDEDDAKFADDENHGEDSKLLENGELEISTDCIEENGEETGDLSMTNDESSCDIMDIDAEQRLNNGTSGKENNFASTEEESSNESLLITDSITLGAEKELRKDSTLKGDCVNGETSAHSSEGVPVPACHNGKVESLDKLLDVVVKKSDNLTVDQLERLYSLLSQCIYRHRRDYDKSQLIEVMLIHLKLFSCYPLPSSPKNVLKVCARC